MKIHEKSNYHPFLHWSWYYSIFSLIIWIREYYEYYKINKNISNAKAVVGKLRRTGSE